MATDYSAWLYPLRTDNRPLDLRFANARISDVSLADVMTRSAVKLCGCGAKAETACKDCGMPLCDDCGEECIDCGEHICDTCAESCYNCGDALCEDCKETGYVDTVAEPFCEICYGYLDPLEDDDDESN